MSTYVPAHLRRLVIDRAANICEYCLIHEEDTFLGLQIEHIISEKHAGQTTESNLALACIFCNRFKGTDIATVLPPDARLCRLYNPRLDLWNKHFEIKNFRIQPLSDIGTATASLLGFNEPDRLLERKALIQAARYPSPAAQQKLG